jgi:hypothetical protein
MSYVYTLARTLFFERLKLFRDADNLPEPGKQKMLEAWTGCKQVMARVVVAAVERMFRKLPMLL